MSIHGALPLVLVVTSVGIILAFVRGCLILEPRMAYVILYWGEYSGTLCDAGFHWVFPVGLSWRKVSLRDQVHQSPVTTVVDAEGNPIRVSAVCV
jgi:regulator of protease activity HflC (stomatin/prohibitin superfamily)